MKCPVCEKKMETMVCACGYDASRDYGAYPTFSPVPGDLETVSHLRERQKNLLLCAGVERWRDMTAIAAGDYHAVGLKKDGTAVAVGTNSDGRCDVAAWKNLAAVYAGGRHTVGLKKDGTLVAVGNNSKGQCDVEKLMDADGMEKKIQQQ